jgi:hypothetical protein
VRADPSARAFSQHKRRHDGRAYHRAAERSEPSRRERGIEELRLRYGLPTGQGGVRAICGAPDAEHVDHDHASGWVRGILCFDCNGGLGQFRDSPEYLANAITYLKGSTCLRVLNRPGVYQIFSRTRGRPPSRSFSV